MKKIHILILAALFFFSQSCSNGQQYSDGTYVKIETDLGDMVVKLYDETPQHRDNFLKLVNESFYDGLLFHRVIENFMIQGGDPNSKNASPGQNLGSGGPGYTIPAEFNPSLFHKKGALAAARLSDNVNPQKESSGSQFYIVQGQTYTNGALDTLELQINNRNIQLLNREYMTKYQQELIDLRDSGDMDAFNTRVSEIQDEVNEAISQLEPYTISAERRAAYTTVGGTPSLDDEYTVFGEVVEGLDVIDKIAAVETNDADRPLTDIKMKITVLK